MVSKNAKNTAASVRQRLLNASRATREPFDLILTRYAIERLLFRLGCSQWGRDFVLKGATLFVLWHAIPTRPTRDLDLLGFGSPDANRLADIFRSVCAEPVVDDGVTFDARSVAAGPIRENNAYKGVRVRLNASLAGAKIPLQVDIGFGDAVVPEPEEIEFPTLLEFPAPTLRSYPIYAVISEKLQALTVLGMANSRMKDYYDLWVFAERAEIHSSILGASIRATFARRRTELPHWLPIGLTAEFSKDAQKIRQWRAFAVKIETDPAPPTLHEVVTVLCEFLGPVLSAANVNKKGEARLWRGGGPWVDVPE
ncbi:MAG: nucleotidyl transferase AbiEii/AbiGii toxin family protein [bacterium]